MSGNLEKLQKLGVKLHEEFISNRPIPFKLNKSCYFCGFSEVFERHHIHHKKFGGDNRKSNILTLCPNHHYLLHRKNYKIIYINGFFYIINRTNNSLISPNKEQHGYKRECPPFIETFNIQKNKLIRIEGNE